MLLWSLVTFDAAVGQMAQGSWWLLNCDFSQTQTHYQLGTIVLN
jgi:hypothetical protein